MARIDKLLALGCEQIRRGHLHDDVSGIDSSWSEEDLSNSFRLDAELLLAYTLQQSRTYLYTWPEKTVSENDEVCYRQLIDRRAAGEPIAHLTGQREFWTLNLAVSPDTLIPRPETELLVETALELLPRTRQQVVDLGTGTGAIALALAAERSQWLLVGGDKFWPAIQLAEKNRQTYQLENVRFVQSDWAVALQSGVWDMVISNPPYIDAQDPHLQTGDVRFEPTTALVAKEQGLAAITEIAMQSLSLLKAGAYLLLEHGFQQKAAVQAQLTHLGYEEVSTRQDLQGHDRVTIARKPISSSWEGGKGAMSLS